MAAEIDDDETRFQDLKTQVDELEIQTFSPEVVARNESTRNTGLQSGDVASLNPYPQWIPIRDFGTLGNLTLVVDLNRVDAHIAKMTLNGDTIFGFDFGPGINKMMEFILDVTIDATGGHAITFGNTIIPASTSIDNTADARTVIRFTTTDGGLTYYAENLTIGEGGVSFPILWPKLDLTPSDLFNQTIDLSLDTGNAHQIQFPGGDIGFQIIGDPANTVAEETHVMFIQDGTGGRSFITVDSSIKNGTEMNTLLDKSANAKTVFKLVTLDGGISYHAELIDLTSGGGEFFGPWTANHDAGNFTLNNIAALQITDSVGDVHGLLQGLAATGIRLSLTSGEQFNIFDSITNIFQMDSTLGLQLFGNDLVMGTLGNITAGGAGEGMTNIGHLDFINNAATPLADLSIYSDATGNDLLVNTGGNVINLSEIGSGIFSDSKFRIQGNGDPTKQLAFEVDTFTTSTTNFYGWPDSSGTVFITPAQEDLNLNTFDIFNIDKLAFMNFASTGSSLNIGFSALGSGGVRGNVTNNGNFQITEENDLHFEFNGNTNTIRVVDSLFNVDETIGDTSFSIAKFNGRTDITEPTKINYQIAGTTIFDITTGFITLANNVSIANVDQIGFRTSGNIIQDDANGMIFNTPVGDDFTWSDGNTEFAILEIDGLFLNDMFIQLDSISPQPTTSGLDIGKIFMDGTNSNHLSVVRDATVVDLESGGGGGDPLGTQEFELTLDPVNVSVAETLIFNGKQGFDETVGQEVVDGRAYYVPIFIAKSVKLVSLGWALSENHTGTVPFSMALYSNKAGGGQNYPDILLASVTGTASATAVDTPFVDIVSTPTLGAGLYWIAYLNTGNDTVTTLTLPVSAANTVGAFRRSFAPSVKPVIATFGYQSVSVTVFSSPAPSNLNPLNVGLIFIPCLFAGVENV